MMSQMKDDRRGDDDVVIGDEDIIDDTIDNDIDDDDDDDDDNDDDDANDVVDDDPIVKRYDVFLSHTLTNGLYLFQYPLRSPTHPYDLNALKEVLFRQKSKRVDMTFEMNTQSEHFDADLADSDAHSTFTLTSTNVPLKANFAIGVMRGNQLHITPLQDILQLRPNFSHLAQDPNVRNLDDLEDETSDGKKKKKASSKGPTAVHATIRTKEQEERMKKSYDYIKRQEEEEKPISLDLFDNKSIESSQAFDKLFEGSFNPVKFDMTSKTYLDTLVPYKTDPLAQLRGRQLSLESLSNLPFEQQVTVALFVAQILHFERIKKLATRMPSEEQLLEALERVALLVDGRWVVKSQVLFNQDNFLASCRDYLLYLLHTKHHVKRMEFMNNTKLNADMTNRILEGVAMLDKKRRVWVLKLPRDDKMCDTYPDIVKRQEQEWKTREKVIKNNLAHKFANVLSQQLQQQQMLRTPASSGGAGATRAAAAAAAGTQQRRLSGAKPSQTMGPPTQPLSGRPAPTLSEHMNPNTLKGTMGMFLQRQFESFGVCSLSLLESRFKSSQSAILSDMGQELRQQFGAMNDQGKIDLMKQVLGRMTRSFDNVGALLPDRKTKNTEMCYVLRNPYPIPNDTRQPIRDAVIELLEKKIKQHREAARSTGRARVEQMEVIEYVRTKTGTSIRPGDFSKIMQELCVQQQDGSWVPKTGTEKG